MWKKISINLNQIKYETGRAILIAFPNNSDLKGYQFWHPSKLVREGVHKACVSLSYTDEFIFQIFKTNKKFEKINETEINAEEFEEAFSVTSENNREKSKETYLEIKEPKKIEIKEIIIPGELKNE